MSWKGHGTLWQERSFEEFHDTIICAALFSPLSLPLGSYIDGHNHWIYHVGIAKFLGSASFRKGITGLNWPTRQQEYEGM
jgi:hypothetical protein